MLKIGRTARRTRRVTARDIELFTELTGDRNPLHYDEAAAPRSRFGGLIVQGGVATITDANGTVVLDGTALVWTEPL